MRCFQYRVFQEGYSNSYPWEAGSEGRELPNHSQGTRNIRKGRNRPNTSALLGIGWAGCHYPLGLVIFRPGVTMKRPIQTQSCG